MVNIHIKNTPDKNELYKKAKDLRREFMPHLSSHRELKDATDSNVDKLIHFEQNVAGKAREYREIMKKLDGDPDARSLDKLRRKN